MDIKTKFSVGDEVYSIRFDNTSGRFKMERIMIAEISIITNRTGTYVRYSSQIWGSDSLFEDNLYKSEKDCIAECQRRNAGLSHGR